MTNEKLILNRTLGFELEGFVYDSDDLSISYCDVGWDGSVEYGNGDGVEVRTEPIHNLNKLETIFDELIAENYNVNETCGLHIHVDTSDFTVKDKAKLLRFGAGIELLMYSLVDPTRYYGKGYHSGNHSGQNGYCVKLHTAWRKVFRDSYLEQPIPFEDMQHLDDLCSYINDNANLDNGRRARAWNGKYQWLNANVEYHPTVEFRIFSATDDYELAQKFGMLAYHIVETVKNSTVRQLCFIINSIYESTSLDEMYSKLFDSIGLDQEFRPQVENSELADYIYNKYCTVNQTIEQEERAV